MAEDQAVRDIRRDLSSRLTGMINLAAQFPEIRVKVLQALYEMWVRFEDLKGMAYDEWQIDPQKLLLIFYMKGGNAFTCAYEPNGIAAQDQGGGTSDWDTQVIVDPWAPLPIQTALYGRIEDIVLDQMVQFGVEIAQIAPAGFPPTPMTMAYTTPGGRNEYYDLTRDEQQTLMQIFDYDNLGLWMNHRKKLNDESVQADLVPGIILNDSIKPFQLFRLGYTWHAKPVTDPVAHDPTFAIGPPIDRPVLMELIDVTLPRRNTVEAVDVWEEMTSGNIVQMRQVGVLAGPTRITVTLPLPSLEYHFNEQALMLCEVADGSSRSASKLNKRFERLNQIYNSYQAQAVPTAPLDAILATMAGVDSLDGPVAAVPSVDAVIAQWAPSYAAGGADDTPVIQRARKMMYLVAARNLQFDPQEYLLARDALRLLAIGLNWNTAITEIGFSDDLALHAAALENGYIDIARLQASGIQMAAYLRLSHERDLQQVSQTFLNQLQQWQAQLQQFLHFAEANGASEETIAWLARTFTCTNFTVESRTHNTLRQNGISYENTFVTFCDGRATASLTLTSASEVEDPFHKDHLGSRVFCASLLDMAEQRKVTAAVTRDYCVRTNLSHQLEILKRLFPGI